MRDFPYDTCLSTLDDSLGRNSPDRPLTSSGDSRRRLLILVGRIVHEGSPATKQQMLQKVRDFYQSPRGEEQEHKRSRSESRERDILEPSLRTTNPGLYSVAVNNHGMQIGARPMYSMESLSADPSLWKTILSFKGQTFEGTAQTAKLAQHEAARQACKYFDLRVV